MKFAFLMDPLETVKAYKDTTYHLMLATSERGHEVFYFNQNTMRAGNANVRATTSKVEVHPSIEKPFTIISTFECDLSEMDAILIRTDPPVDRRYLYATLVLDLISGSTLVVNRPSGIRNWNEKLAAMLYPSLTPETLISNDTAEILQFRDEFGRLTLKPIDGHGGEGIIFLETEEADAAAKVNQVTNNGTHWIIAQQYLPDAQTGDKRILLLDGEPLGAILRVHAEGKELNNLDQGATAQAAELTERDLEICSSIKDGLLAEGIIFSGIDVIGGMLIEINVTSPTGLQELCRFDERAYNHDIMSALEQKIQARHTLKN